MNPTIIKTQPTIEHQSKGEPQDDYSNLVPLLGSVFVIASSSLWYHASKSKNTEPQITFGTNSILVEIPSNTSRKTFSGFGPDVEAIAMEIEILNRETKDRQIVQLTRDFPFKKVEITPDQSYAYKWRTKEEYSFWSNWSKLKSFRSQRSPFSTLQGPPSRERCNQILQRIKTGHHFNALVLGRPGVGKSCTINTLASAVAGQRKYIAKVQPDHVATTRHLIEHEVVPGKAYLYDMPGIEGDVNANLQDFRAIAQGNFNDMTVMRLVEDQAQKKSTLVNSEEPKPKMDVVIFVISAVNLPESRETHQKMMKILKEENIPYIGIITKVDLVSTPEEPAISRENFSEDCRVIEKCKGIPIEIQFPIINYRGSDEIRPEIDEIILHALETAQNLASSDLVKA